MKNAIWIAWDHQVRNKSMAGKLGIQLYVPDLTEGRIRRYLWSIAGTLLALVKIRPRIVITSNPSLVLNYLALFLRPILRFRLVSDAHYCGVYAPDGRRWMQRLLDYCNRSADLVIVTNIGHADYVNRIGGRAFVCEDPLPYLSALASRGDDDQEKTVFVISSFDFDEPYMEVLGAAKTLTEDGFGFYVSGNPGRVGIDPAMFPHVRFTGYVPAQEFYARLLSSAVVVDLTTKDNCLVCGAYEAMAAEKPVVLSDHRALRQYFTHGAVFTANEKDDLVRSIKQAYENRSELTEDIKAWKLFMVPRHDAKIRDLRETILGLNRRLSSLTEAAR